LGIRTRIGQQPFQTQLSVMKASMVVYTTDNFRAH